MTKKDLHTPSIKKDSLKKRYFFKLSSNIATIPLYFLQEAILPRILGVSAYGNFNFLTAFYTQLINFLDLGTSICLRTNIAKRPHEPGIISFYLRIISCIFISALFCGAIMYIPKVSSTLIPHVPLWMVIPTILCVYMMWLGNTFRGVNDAFGNTTSSEVVRIIINSLAALLLLGLFSLKLMNLPLLYLYQGGMYLAMFLGFTYVFIKAWKLQNPTIETKQLYTLTPKQKQTYTREYSAYCSPLFIIALCSMLASIIERWVLQYYGGSNAQGYFSLSQKIGMACFLFISAMMPLLQRDLAIAHEKKDMKAMATIIDRLAPLLYSIAAWFSCFTCVEAFGVINIFAGLDFAKALLPVQIMALYPIHQCYGQVANTIHYASNDTKSLRNITVISLLLGLVCSWVFIAPQNRGGLSLGAEGLSIKMVLIQFFTVNLLLWKCSRHIAFSFTRNIVHQIVCPVTMLFFAFCAKKMTHTYLPFESTSFLRFFLSGLAYTLFTMVAVYIFPFLCGLTRQAILFYIRKGLYTLIKKK